jgi:hypothetical protein
MEVSWTSPRVEERRESLMPVDMGQRVVFERETTRAINRARPATKCRAAA